MVVDSGKRIPADTVPAARQPMESGIKGRGRQDKSGGAASATGRLRRDPSYLGSARAQHEDFRQQRVIQRRRVQPLRVSREHFRQTQLRCDDGAL